MGYLVEEPQKYLEVGSKRLGKLVWRLQNRLSRSHRREKALRKGMREWRVTRRLFTIDTSDTRKGEAVRYEYRGRVSSVEDAAPVNEFDLSKESMVEISGDAYASIRVPQEDAGALYGKRVRVIVEVDE